jgi:hypothetical protein
MVTLIQNRRLNIAGNVWKFDFGLMEIGSSQKNEKERVNSKLSYNGY